MKCAKCKTEIFSCTTCGKKFKKGYLICAKEKHYCNFKCCSHPHLKVNYNPKNSEKFETWVEEELNKT